MIIEFSKEGRSLGTRATGREIRLKISQAIENGEFVTLDFNNVDVISNSFTDECIGKLVTDFGIEKLKSSTTFTNTNKIIQFVLKKVINDRLIRKKN